MTTDIAKKYGRTTEATPAKWQKDYVDYNAPLENGAAAAPTKALGSPTTSDAEPVANTSEQPSLKATEITQEKGGEETKKRKRHEGETGEEKAERKRKKKEKKEKRKSQKEEGSDGE